MTHPYSPVTLGLNLGLLGLGDGSQQPNIGDFPAQSHRSIVHLTSLYVI